MLKAIRYLLKREMNGVKILLIKEGLTFFPRKINH